MITGPQCRAARALVEFTRERLAQLSGIDAGIIEHFERKIGSPSDEQVQILQETLEKSAHNSYGRMAADLVCG